VKPLLLALAFHVLVSHQLLQRLFLGIDFADLFQRALNETCVYIGAEELVHLSEAELVVRLVLLL